MEDNIIEVTELEYFFGEVKAVDNISFAVKKGEIFSFLGPNGAGKSTVINILTTLLPVQKGSVKIAGYNLEKEPEMVRESIGIVFQELTLDRDMTVREILEYHGRLYSMPKVEREERIDELLGLVELEWKRDTLTRHLSGGMKRRLEIARGLMTRPNVLFLDEPTIGLDPQTRIRIWDYVKDINHEGTTIFLTTHYMDEADQLSDRISIIDHGKIVVTGSPWELKNALGQDLIYLETSDNWSASNLLKKLESVKGVREKSKGIIIMVNVDGTHLLPEIMDKLRNGGIKIKAVNLKKPSMDDVFVHYTGRELRDAGTEKGSTVPLRAGRR
ncbi:MAG: ATP-binding cassette domain-containing protein [Methanosarcina sp.]|nr:ATP-binding cassette domain-containing protein [Methanosarcina sp.]MDD3317652.1 ATP-binding cassette domain-containing protein [Methanosarcina sp.]MDD4305934.1 ATP-binding cassette domain-containing protein [Methanosarcina sp.]MDD4621373.1 ATP-binding cassette domain-containing protein [Methanosarcina sp.]NLN43731.1 ATP-binding cassette domain-containing protein [Methanosarcina sp.]